MSLTTPTEEISKLLAAARQQVLERFSGQPATLGPGGTLERASDVVYWTILGQVAAGMWRKYGVADVDDMRGLRVEVGLGNQLLGEPPLKIDYDFAKTALPLLVVSNARVS